MVRLTPTVPFFCISEQPAPAMALLDTGNTSRFFMITVSELSKSYGTKTLFDNVSVKFTPGNRYGLTGPNGAGKSTFLKILTGEIEPSNRGSITKPKKVGVLSQDQFAFDNERIIDTVMMGNAGLWQALVERNALCNASEFT